MFWLLVLRRLTDVICISSIVEYIKLLKLKINLLIFPGGFFEGNNISSFRSYLRKNPPNVALIVGWDKKTGKNDKKREKQNSKREIWAVSSNGEIKTRIREAWIGKGGKINKEILKNIQKRKCIVGQVSVDLYCCGDVLIDKRHFNGKLAAITAHQSARGRAFSPAMRNLNKPVFLSHFVMHPYKTKDFAYNGATNLKAIAVVNNNECSLEQVEWQARIYSL